MRTKISTDSGALVENVEESLRDELSELEFDLDQPEWMVGRTLMNKMMIRRLHMIKKINSLVDNS